MAKDQVIRPRRRKGRSPESERVHKQYRYQKLRRAFRALCTQRQSPCWRCGCAIDYAAPALAPNAFELDHAEPVSMAPHLAYEPSNFRPSCSRCNRSRGNGSRGNGTRGTAALTGDATTSADEWVRPDW
ncbi:HNH endonuclease [Mycolicibacterium austroafricanum]|uniref:HNH endonuclease signature motif containing protein n=1 Tax=Mycolicibacterium austroafricanum TaxID=39687 RepID=A0ABT8HFQ3_MYCAO|nr:HNH endonuclease signature motif containing protein [Mycolicibacterium austroafricanum]MDN4519603.1 HNH endonuclease signature motif containing protein [Mycolicibacterium austroafricanum]QZT69850.1 HNH endonuclease [Mycolicibacterium austroafricanum]